MFLQMCISEDAPSQPFPCSHNKGIWGRRRSPTGTFHKSRQWLPHSYFVCFAFLYFCIFVFNMIGDLLFI